MKLPSRTSVVDDLTRRDHWHLGPDDTCHYFGEYSARRGYSYSDTNNLIINLKKSTDKRGTPQWQYKLLAIESCTDAIRGAFDQNTLRGITLVPMPPSKSREDPAYDDRMTAVLMGLGAGYDIRELLRIKVSTVASHTTDARPTPLQLFENFVLEESLLEPTPTAILLLDDVLTTGAHFVAAKRRLREALPDVPITGLFIARVLRDADVFDDL